MVRTKAKKTVEKKTVVPKNKTKAKKVKITKKKRAAKKEKAPGLFQMFARMAYTNPNVMISLMNKFVANKEKIEHSTDGPLEIDIKRINAED